MRPPLRSLAVGGASTILALLMLEAGLSHWRPLQDSRFEPDQQLLFRLRPGFRSTVTLPPEDGARTVEFVVNSGGFRGPELPAVPAGPRILVYGDSYIESYFTPLPDMFVARLAEQLGRNRGRPVEAVNAGVAGYGPDQVSLRLETELELLAPDAVVLGLFAGNDFGDLLRNKIFRLDRAGRLVRGSYELSPKVREGLAPRTWRRLALWRTFRPAVRHLFDRASGWLRTGRAVGSIAWALRESEREWQEYCAGDSLVTKPFIDHYDFDMSLLPDSEAARTKRRLMTAVLSRIQRQVSSRGVALLAVVIPAPDDLRSGPQAEELRRRPSYRPSALTDALAQAAREAGIPCVDLYQSFLEQGGDGLYDLRDLHWNARAQALAARLVAQALEERGIAR